MRYENQTTAPTEEGGTYDLSIYTDARVCIVAWVELYMGQQICPRDTQNLHPPPCCGAKTEEKMKTKVTFKDSFDDNKISVEIIHKKNIRLEMGDSDVWLSLDDFNETYTRGTETKLQRGLQRLSGRFLRKARLRL